MSSNNKINNFEFRKIQIKAIIPYIRFLEKELGKDTVKKLLEKYAKERVSNAKKLRTEQIDFKKELSETEKFCNENNLEYTLVHQDNDHLEFDITKCAYTEMMKELNAQDIGHLLICNNDFVKAVQDGLILKRTKTCMEGHEYCDFKYEK